MFRYDPGFHHGPGVFGWLFMALFLAGLILAVIALVRLWSAPRRPLVHRHDASFGPPVDPALMELRLRYARGEIDAEEYSRRSHDLGYPMAPPPAAPPPTTGEPPPS